MRFIGPCVFVDGSLIAADLHLGFEDRTAASGLVTDTEHVVLQLRSLIERASRFAPVERIVLDGDVIDDFALKSLPRRIAITRALKRLSDVVELVLVRGNHDPMLATLKLDTVVRDSFRSGTTLVAHGDLPLAQVASEQDVRECERIVIGHEHPVLALFDGIRLERFKCFVRIPHVETGLGVKEVVVLPSAHPDVLGTDVDLRFRSPVLSGSFPDAEVIVVGDPPRSFGTLASLFTQE